MLISNTVCPAAPAVSPVTAPGEVPDVTRMTVVADVNPAGDQLLVDPGKATEITLEKPGPVAPETPTTPVAPETPATPVAPETPTTPVAPLTPTIPAGDTPRLVLVISVDGAALPVYPRLVRTAVVELVIDETE